MRDVLAALMRSRAGFAAAGLTTLLLLAAMGAPWLALHDPMDLASLSILDNLRPPLPWPDSELRFPLGTDSQGRDVLSAILFGLRLSLLIGVCAVLLALAIGLLAGLAAGYGGRVTDAVLMRIAEVQMTFPAILSALMIDGLVMAALPEPQRAAWQVPVIVAAIALSLWPGLARTVRASTQVERNKDYVRAAQVIGVPAWRILLTHVLPNIVGPVMVLATIDLGMAILTEATLSYLGVGLPPTRPSLGTLIRTGSEFLLSGSWWVAIFPGLALMLTVLAFNLMGDRLRDALNPRLR